MVVWRPSVPRTSISTCSGTCSRSQPTYSTHAESVAPANAYLRDSAWLTRKFVTTPLRPLRFYLEVGVLEAGLVNPVAEHRRLRDLLEAKGYHTVYSEFPGGHDYFTWQNSLGEGLIALLAQERTRR